MGKNVTIIRLPLASTAPWGFALRVNEASSGVFHAFIDDLKQNVLPRDRKWMSGPKWWLLKANVVDVVAAVYRLAAKEAKKGRR